MLRQFAHPSACCCVMLGVVAQSVWNRSNFWATQHFFCPVIAEAWRNNVGSVCRDLPTLLGPRTRQDGYRLIKAYKVLSYVQTDAVTSNNVASIRTGLYGLYLPHNALQFQHCWELLHPFAHHFQHRRNNWQCWELLLPFVRSLKYFETQNFINVTFLWQSSKKMGRSPNFFQDDLEFLPDPLSKWNVKLKFEMIEMCFDIGKIFDLINSNTLKI